MKTQTNNRSVMDFMSSEIRKRPIPRFGPLLPLEKGIVRVGPLPSGLFERLESATAAAPMDVPPESTSAIPIVPRPTRVAPKEIRIVDELEPRKTIRAAAPKVKEYDIAPAPGSGSSTIDMSNVPKPLAGDGGAQSFASGYTIHTFTSGGTFTIG